MKENLSARELEKLIRNVFSPGPSDTHLAILTDVPDKKFGDNPLWRERRVLSRHWLEQLEDAKIHLGLEEVEFFYYPNVGSHNAELPKVFFTFDGDPRTVDRKKLEQEGNPVSLRSLFAKYPIMLVPTEFSATAPLKLNARKYGFRAATMPGFSRAMIPALRLDYGEINKRVAKLKKFFDEALKATVQFLVEKEQYQVNFDLRFRTAHASGGLFPRAGAAGNLPSGETYIVPYEGERKEKSFSEGILPVQFEDEVVMYRLEENRAVEVLSKGRHSDEERERIKEEPGYSNIAELGFGVLRDFGIQPVGEILLDEKLGFHLAFGRSDHLGGVVGARNFTSPDKVIHIDRIYIPETQPLIKVQWVKLTFEDEKPYILMEDGRYMIF
jgi:hypothetical protein